MFVLILLLLITIYLIKNGISNFAENIDDLLSYKNKESDKEFVKMVKNKKESDIKIIPYGCFKDIEQRFFIRKLNPFSNVKEFNSVFVISENSTSSDFKNLFNQIKQNGFESYINSLQNKYKDSFNFTLKELGLLCLYSGYSYMSIITTSPKGNRRIYFSYSPPMNKENIFGQFNEDEYNKYVLKGDINYQLYSSSGSNLCGYECINDKNYGCGSVNYPLIKSPVTVAVYKVE